MQVCSQRMKEYKNINFLKIFLEFKGENSEDAWKLS